MKKIRLMMLVFVLTFSHISFVPVKAASTEIYTKEDLNNIRKAPSSSYILMNDIIFEDADFASGGAFYNSGQGWQPITRFTGTLDGNGHVIQGLKITNRNQKNIGFFEENAGTIKNLGFTEIEIYGRDVSGYDNFGYEDTLGTIAGINRGTIDGCYVSGYMNVKAEMTGGLVGINHSTIRNSYNSAEIESTLYGQYRHQGGIAGYNYGTVSDCYNTGLLTTVENNHYDYVGGIVGYNERLVTRCHNTGNILGALEYSSEIGGIVGFNLATISYCYNTGKVRSYSDAGGIVGRNYGYTPYNGKVSYCYNTGDITTTMTSAGGICGNNFYATIQDCYNTGTIYGNGPGVYNCYAAGITADCSGEVNRGKILRCYNLGKIVMASSTGRLFQGGITGFLYGGEVANCYNIESDLPLWTREDEIANPHDNGYINQEDLTNPASYVNFDFDAGWTLDPESSQYRYPTIKNLAISNTNYSLTYTPPASPIKEGEQESLNASVSGANPHCRRVVYTSSDESVATVDVNGVIHAVGGGDVVITAIAANNKKISFQLHVKGLSETDAKIVLSDASCAPGNATTIYVNVENNPGIASMLLKIEYDPSLVQITGWTDFNRLGTQNHSNDFNSNSGVYYLSWENDTATTNYTYSGRVAGLDIKVLEGVTFDSTPITASFNYDQYDIMDKDLNKVYFNIDQGSISYPKISDLYFTSLPTKTTYLLGDASLDLTGMCIMAEYDDGSSKTVSSGELKISGFDSSVLGTQTIELSYEDLSVWFDIEIIDKAVSSIEVAKLPTKLEYYQHQEAFDSTGGKITLIYNTGETEVIDLSLATVSGFDNTVVGKQTLTVTYNNVSTTFDVEIISEEVIEIKINSLPNQLTYLEGKDLLNLSGGTLTMTYNSGRVETIDLSNANITGFNNTIVGKQTLTVTYNHVSTTFDVEIIEKSITSIEVTTLPTKLSYLEGKDTLDVSGGKLTLYYNNDTSKVIDLSEAKVTGFNNALVGKQTLTVTYENKTTTFNIEIIEKSIESIEVSTLPTKVTYLEGKDELDVFGGRLRITYNNDTSVEILLLQAEISGFDNTKVGKQTLTVTYENKTTTFDIEIIEKSISSIEVTTLPTKLSYLEGKESLDLSGGKLTLSYNNDTSEVIDLSEARVTGFNNALVGKQTLMVSYKGKSTKLQVEVIKKSLESIEITKLPTKTEYNFGESLDLSGGELTVYYNNDTFEVIDLNEATISGYDASLVGEQQVMIIYLNHETTLTIKVNEIQVLYGDVNRDGRVNQQDRMILTRCIAKWDGYPMEMMDLVAADVNLDGRINPQDRMILTRYIAKWAGYEKLPQK